MMLGKGRIYICRCIQTLKWHEQEGVLGVKVVLKSKPWLAWRPSGHRILPVTKAWPYYKSRRGKYVHRIREMHNHWWDGELKHTSVHFWCGNTGFLQEKGYLMPEVEDGEVLCATCEGRAIGAGLDGAKTINGRQVEYSPRRQNGQAADETQ